MKNCLTKSITPLLLLSVCSFIVTGPAHAGEWTIERYEVNGGGNSTFVNVTFDNITGWRSQADTARQVFDWVNPQQPRYRTWYNGKFEGSTLYPIEYWYTERQYAEGASQVYWYKGTNTSNGGRSRSGFAPQSASFNYSVRAIFRWKRDKINSDIPNPDDNPPEYCWFLETTSMSGSQYLENGQETIHHKDEEANFTKVEHPFISYDPSMLIVNEEAGAEKARFNLNDYRVTGIKALKNQDLAIGPERNFKSQIDLHTYITTNPGGGASVSWYYQATPAKFNVLSRRKEDHDPNDLVTNFSSQSSVLAGGNVTDLRDHEADIVLELPGAGNAKMKHIPFIEKINPEGVSIPVKLLPTDATYTGTLNNGRAPIGIVRSRDKIDATKSVWIAANKSWSNSTLINHDWGQVTWKMGVNGDKPWDPNFWVGTGQEGTGEYQEWLWAKATVFDNKPLTRHSMKFIITRLQVRETNDEGEEVERIYTTTPLTSSSVPVEETTLQPEIIVVPKIDSSDSFEFAPAVVTDANNGIYKTKMTIKESPERVVRHFIVELEDQGVYKANP